MSIYVTGDTHGDFDIRKLGTKQFKDGRYLTKNDYVVIAGDFGLIWDVNESGPNEQYWLDWLSNKPWTTLFVDGNHECVSKDSEILTELGWMNVVDVYKSANIKIANFDMGTKCITFDLPLKKIKSYKKEAIVIEGKNTKQITSLDHDIVLNDKKIKAVELLNKRCKENKFTLKGNSCSTGVNISNNLIRLLTWTIMDGTIVDYSIKNPNSKKCRIQFKLSRNVKIKKLLALLDTMKLPYTHRIVDKEGNNKVDPHIICMYSDTARMINTLLNGSKQIPPEWRNFNKEQVLVFLNTLIDTDGSKLSTGNTPILWRSISKNDSDIVQEFCIKNDIYCVIKKFENMSGFSNGLPQYISRIYFNKKLNTFIKTTKINYNDYMYCFTMPKKTLITRIEGKVAFTGNCFDRLEKLPLAKMFGGIVGVVSDSIFHLKRGEIYTIEDKKFFTFGGAYSIDKIARKEFISWWSQELPSKMEMDWGFENLEKHNNTVDYIITHTAPIEIVEELSKFSLHMDNGYYAKKMDSCSKYLSEIKKIIKFNKWYFGHFHEDREMGDGFHVVYNDIIKLQ